MTTKPPTLYAMPNTLHRHTNAYKRNCNGEAYVKSGSRCPPPEVRYTGPDGYLLFRVEPALWQQLFKRKPGFVLCDHIVREISVLLKHFH